MNALIMSLCIIFPVFFLAWLIQVKQQNAGWVDVIWSFSVGILGAVYALMGTGSFGLKTLIFSVYLIWFSRLGIHLFKRVLHSVEDGRYQAMREWAKPREHIIFLIFYGMQASWVWLFSLPAWVVANSASPPLLCLILGILIIVIAFIGESTADSQLKVFIRNPKNQGLTCNTGLWRYSRHPNYFFEWLHWFAYPLLGWHSEFAAWLWLSPIVMFIFLYFVTGIPYTEQQALRTRGENYRAYQRKTSAFIPWRPTQ